MYDVAGLAAPEITEKAIPARASGRFAFVVKKNNALHGAACVCSLESVGGWLFVSDAAVDFASLASEACRPESGLPCTLVDGIEIASVLVPCEATHENSGKRTVTFR